MNVPSDPARVCSPVVGASVEKLIQEIKDLFARNDGGTFAEAEIIDDALTRLLSSAPAAQSESVEANTHEGQMELWVVCVMSREGRWYYWTASGWQSNPKTALHEADVIEAGKRAARVLVEVPWVFGVKIVDILAFLRSGMWDAVTT